MQDHIDEYRAIAGNELRKGQDMSENEFVELFTKTFFDHLIGFRVEDGKAKPVFDLEIDNSLA